MSNSLDKMCFTEFIYYLKSKGIKYIIKEDVDIDAWFTCFTEVIPKNNKLKIRYFDNDGGGQLF